MNLNSVLARIAKEYQVDFYRSDYLGTIQYAFQTRAADGGICVTMLAYLRKVDEHNQHICLALEFEGDSIYLDPMQQAKLTDYVLDARVHFMNVHTFDPNGGGMGRGINKFKF